MPFLRYGHILVVLCVRFFGGVWVVKQLGEWGAGLLGVGVCVGGELGALGGGVMVAEFTGKVV